MYTYDVVIIGAGPTGLATAIEAQRQNLSYIILEKGSIVNTVRYYPTNMTFFSTAELLELDDLPFPTTSPGKRPTRNEALEYYIRVAQKHNLRMSLYTTVQKVDKVDDLFHIDTNKGAYQAKYLVAATGYYDKPNRLNIPGEDQANVSHYYDEAYPYVGLNVLVVGGSNTAVETSLDLFRHGANVTMVHRGDALKSNVKYWMKPDIENRIKEGSIPAYWNTAVRAVEGNQVLVEDEHGQQFYLQADQVFLLTGYHPDSKFLQGLGIEVDSETLKPTYDENTLESNVPGLYVAGVILAGYETAKIFIENGRHHGKPIIRDILQKENQHPHSLSSGAEQPN